MTKNKIIRKEFNGTVRASFPKKEADRLIAEAKKNGYEEKFCFEVYAKAAE